MALFKKQLQPSDIAVLKNTVRTVKELSGNLQVQTGKGGRHEIIHSWVGIVADKPNETGSSGSSGSSGSGPDLPGNVYWVKRAYASNSPDSLWTDSLKIDPWRKGDAQHLVVPATNIGEPENSRTFSPGQNVVVHEVRSVNDLEQPRFYVDQHKPGPFLGVVVCHGPDGEDDPADNTYWVVAAKIDAGSSGSDAGSGRISIVQLSPQDPGYWIRLVANLFEANGHGGEGTHNIRQNTPVAVFEGFDSHGKRYFYMIAADEDTSNGEPCSSSSGSSSSPSSSSPSSSSPSSSSPSSSSPSSGSPSSSSPSATSSDSGSGNSGSGNSGSGNSGSGNSGSGNSGSGNSGGPKSSAIVPATWTGTGYSALFIAECPEVRFDDVSVVTVPQKSTKLPIDPRFIEVCEPGSIEVCGCQADYPVAVGASVDGNEIRVRFTRSDKRKVRLVVRLTGIRKGFAGVRFPDRTQQQFEANERFIRSAYPAAGGD